MTPRAQRRGESQARNVNRKQKERLLQIVSLPYPCGPVLHGCKQTGDALERLVGLFDQAVNGPGTGIEPESERGQFGIVSS